MSIIIVHGTIEIQDGNLDEALDLSLEHVKRSRKESGCISHTVHIDVENRNRLVFYEQWQNMETLQTHFAVPESSEFVKALGRLATDAPKMSLFQSSQLQ